MAQYSGETTRGLEALSAEQQKGFVAAVSSDEFSAVALASADAEMWERMRVAQPALAGLSDAELEATFQSYVNAKPSLFDVLFKTPVGPVFIVNIILAVTNFSWCDVPFVSSDTAACAELAARTAAGTN